MKWFAKKVFDGGGKDLKNQRKSRYCLYKALNRVKILIQNFIKKFENLNKKLTFAAYDKIGGVGSRAARVFSVFNSVASHAHIFLRDALASKKLDSHRVTKSTGLRAARIASYESIGEVRFRAVIGKILSSIRKLRLRSANCGAILIEFAICMPVLIILLFYINDLARLKRLHSQTEFVAQQMANILQNISQKREGADRKITCNDIRYAASLAYLSMFPGKTNFPSAIKKSDLGYNGLGYIFCVKGNSDLTASVLWTRRFHFADGVTAPSTVAIDQAWLSRSNIKRLTNASPSEIYPTLKINPGDIKIIVECGVHYSRSAGYGFTDGRLASKVSASEAFGLRLFKLSPDITRAGANDSIFFLSAVIFKPKDGLFNETPPQEQN